jgi:hypothetical protein
MLAGVQLEGMEALATVEGVAVIAIPGTPDSAPEAPVAGAYAALVALAGARSKPRGGELAPLAVVLVGLLLVKELRGEEVVLAGFSCSCRPAAIIAIALRDVLVGVPGALPLPLGAPAADFLYSSMRTLS